MDINGIRFDKNGLVPAIAQDAITNQVLMQAYMSKESLELTLNTGVVHYFSRSRNKIWKKGEESGHFQHVKEIFSDCDNDSILLKVLQEGDTACHTGARSCFFNKLADNGHIANAEILYENVKTIKQRKANPVQGSYTNYLLDKGIDKICKKIGEESSEVIIAAKNNDKNETAAELADLYYHTLVLMETMDMSLQDVFTVLESRHNSERKRDY